MVVQKPTGDPLTDPAALAYWWMQYKDGNTRLRSKFSEHYNACYELFSYVTKSSGYDHRSDQYWVSLALPKDGDIVAAIIELNYFLPYIKLTDGYKHISIIEYTRSASGMYELREYGESDIRMIITTYGRESELRKFDSWRGAFEYAQANHWYGHDE